VAREGSPARQEGRGRERYARGENEIDEFEREMGELLGREPRY
jgi:hypothetical protein